MTKEETPTPLRPRERKRGDGGVYVSKLDQETIDRLARALRNGTSFEGAARYAGISRATFYNWLDAAKQPNPDPMLVQFAIAVEDALGIWEVGAMERINADESWQSDAWALERRKPHEYGRRSMMEISEGGDPGQVAVARALERNEFDVSALDPEEYDVLMVLVRKMSDAYHGRQPQALSA